MISPTPCTIPWTFNLYYLMPYFSNCCSQLPFLGIYLNCWFSENKGTVLIFYFLFFLVLSQNPAARRHQMPDDLKLVPGTYFNFISCLYFILSFRRRKYIIAQRYLFQSPHKLQVLFSNCKLRILNSEQQWFQCLTVHNSRLTEVGGKAEETGHSKL